MTNAIKADVTSRDGALRFVDAAAIRRGLASVLRCEAHSLGLPIQHGVGPVAPMQQVPQHYMRRDGADYGLGGRKEVEGFGFADDVIMLATHGTTHVDALCHVFAEGRMFGGVPASEVTSAGARQLGVETVPPIVTRALIIDAVPQGRTWLEPGEGISSQQIDALLGEAGLTPEPGDALIVRTGSVEAYRAGEKHDKSWPGLSADCVDWVVRHRISIVGADNIAVEVVPSGIKGCALPLHIGLLRDQGVLFLELLDLAPFKGRSLAGMLTLNPLKIVGGTASPLAPMVMI